MTRALIIHQAGPAISLQDLGRTGTIAQGLTRGGAMDRLALHEAAALLQQPVSAAIEMIGMGGVFEVTQDTRVALTGAPMRADINGVALAWNACHLLHAGSTLTLGGVTSGAIGYMTLGGGINLPPVLGSLSSHLAAGIGTVLSPGSQIPLHPDPGKRTGWHFPPPDRMTGGTVHIIRSLQTDIFGEETLQRFLATAFVRDARANRQGIRLTPDGAGFAAEGGLTVVSEIISPGDIQITGDGAPFVLMCESQTTGGYPRIATVIPSDLPKVAQAPLNAPIRIELLDRDAAIACELRARAYIKSLPGLCQPLIRDPADIPDLLEYTLIDGVISAQADPFEGDPE